MAEVDTMLPAYPTGAAADLAARHAAEHALKLYGGWFCPFVQRSWIVLEEKRVGYQYVEINPYKKAPEFLELNPRGLVPTLAVPVAVSPAGKQERKPLYESLVLCDYLDEEYADEGAHGPTLYPAVPYERARCRLWIDHISGKIVPGFYRLIQHTPEKDYSLDDARASLHGHIRALVREMAAPDEGPWFLGAAFSMVDVALAPWAKRLFLIDYYKTGGLGIPTAEGGGGEEDDAVWRRWHSWFAAVTTRPSVTATWSEDDHYIQAYKRYAEDTTQSEVAQATRKGQRLP